MAKIWVKLNYPSRQSFSDLANSLMITGDEPVEVEENSVIHNALTKKWLLEVEAPKTKDDKKLVLKEEDKKSATKEDDKK